MLPEMPLMKLQCHLVARETVSLPAFTGNILRSAFGEALRLLCCADGQAKCGKCILEPDCLYAQIFETSKAHVSAGRYQLDRYPQPFVLEPPVGGSATLQRGEGFSCGILLMGNGTRYWRYIIDAFRKFENVGLGRPRRRFALKKVTDMFGSDESVIYNSESKQLLGIPEIRSLTDIAGIAGRCKHMTLNFITPMRTRKEGRLVEKPDFTIITQAQLRRLELLYQAHAGNGRIRGYQHSDEENKEYFEPQESYHLLSKKELQQLLTVANTQVSTELVEFRPWIDTERYSVRQQCTMRLDGFTGKISFSGQLNELLPYFRAGELVHVGKQCSFGHGWYRITLG